MQGNTVRYIATGALIFVAGLCVPSAQADKKKDDHGHAPAAPAPAAAPATAPAPAAPATLNSTGGKSTPAAKGDATKGSKPAAKDDDKTSKNEKLTEKTDKAEKAEKSEKTPAKGEKAEKAEKSEEKPKAVEPETGYDADKALEMLKDGNQRWVDGAPTGPNTSPERMANVADTGQKPFVTVLTCADSRLPVERIFDRGVGDVFVVRVAGNVAGGSEVGTIEYGVGHLKTPLLVVMGHTKCGAVAAAATGAEVHGKIRELVDHINPAVERVKRNNPGADAKEVMTLSVRENVWQSVFDLYKTSPEIRSMAAEGKIKVIGAVYDISSGKVTWLGEHPWQSELLQALKAREATSANAHAPANATTAPATADAQPAHAAPATGGHGH